MCKQAVIEVEVSRITIKELRAYIVKADDFIARQDQLINNYSQLLTNVQDYIKVSQDDRVLEKEEKAKLDQIQKNTELALEEARKKKSFFSQLKDSLLVILAAIAFLK